MKTERWWTTGGHCFGPQVGEVCKSKITPVTLSDDIEPSILQRTLVAITIRDCAQIRSRRPGHRKGEIAGPRSHHIIDTEDGTRSQYAGNLACKLLLVLYVHPDVQHVRSIEAAFNEWHG